MGQNYALVVDDHPLVASGIANFLITHCQFKQACVVTNEDDCYRQIRDHGPPRLLVIDFWLSSGTALKLLKEVNNFTHRYDSWWSAGMTIMISGAKLMPPGDTVLY